MRATGHTWLITLTLILSTAKKWNGEIIYGFERS